MPTEGFMGREGDVPARVLSDSPCASPAYVRRLPKNSSTTSKTASTHNAPAITTTSGIPKLKETSWAKSGETEFMILPTN